jgi:hypothetical protein
MPKKQWREKALKQEWLTKAGALTDSKLSKLMASMDEYDTESNRALGVIESFGAFRDVEVSVDDDIRGGARCDDVPIVRLVRIREFEARMMLQDLRVQEEDGFKANGKEAAAALKSLRARLAQAGAGIKEASKEYKTDIRSLSKTEEEALAAHAKSVEAVLDALRQIKDEALALINTQRKAAGKSGVDHGTYVADCMPQQADKWKTRWLQISKAVNTVMGQQWAQAERAIRDAAVRAGAPAQAATETWDLDYIGSLAKGVKGPPKQHIAFDPDKFDVDANLSAPSLSSWALGLGSMPDRDRLWGRKDTNLKQIPALRSFQDGVHKALCKIPGYDADEEFEVVVQADVVVDDESYELVKAGIIELKKFTPGTLFTNFLKVPGVRAMLDDDDVPLPAFADDLLGELHLYASNNNLSLGTR